MAYIPPLNGGRINATISGNTAGAGALISTGNMVLAGGSNITLSQNGQSISIVGGAAGGSVNFSAGTTSANLASVTFANGNNVSFGLNGSTITGSVASSLTNINLSAGTTSNNLSAVTFANSNAINFGLNGSAVTASAAFSNANGVSFGLSGGSVITGSHNAITSQTNQTMGFYVTGNTTATAGGGSTSSNPDARLITISGAGAVSAGFSSNSMLVISAPTQTVQTQNLQNIVLSGSTAGAMATISSGTMTLAGGNNITLSQNGNAVTISGANAGGSPNFSAGTTSNNLAAVVFSNSNGHSFGLNGSTITAAQALTFSAGSQSTLTASGTMNATAFNLNGVGGVSVGFSSSSAFVSAPPMSVITNAGAVGLSSNGSTVTISSPVMSLGMYSSAAAGGSTSGNTVIVSNGFQIAAGSNITLSQATGASGATVSIIGGAGAGGGTISATALGNTAVSSAGTMDIRSVNLSGGGAASVGISNNTIHISAPATSSLVGANGLSVSTNGSTISIQPTPVTTYVNMLPISTASQTWGNMGVTSGSAFFFPISVGTPVQFNALRLASTLSFVSSTISGAQSITQSFGIYSQNGSTLSRISSNSLSYAVTNSSVSGTVSFATSTGTGGYGYNTSSASTTADLQSSFGTGAWRLIDLQFGNTMSLSAGMYWLALLRKESTANAAIGISHGLMGNMHPITSTTPFAQMGVATSALSSHSNIRMPFVGFGPYNASTNALPSSASMASINNTVTVLPFVTFLST